MSNTTGTLVIQKLHKYTARMKHYSKSLPGGPCREFKKKHNQLCFTDLRISNTAAQKNGQHTSVNEPAFISGPVNCRLTINNLFL
jgi:hypothetical protein